MTRSELDTIADRLGLETINDGPWIRLHFLAETGRGLTTPEWWDLQERVRSEIVAAKVPYTQSDDFNFYVPADLIEHITPAASAIKEIWRANG